MVDTSSQCTIYMELPASLGPADFQGRHHIGVVFVWRKSHNVGIAGQAFLDGIEIAYDHIGVDGCAPRMISSAVGCDA
ncbi:hypothetical protein BITS_1791 [Bifidobacterium tsurumiense]|uniref:Uncharacterized protein n=1 Tax=Bifidobacterium tsurumiense TaxID=356829 RepID=A0A087EDD6_9BIFI|nr:hypothetical protein BITS_1791 [Bifidobacterium tsurumiense]